MQRFEPFVGHRLLKIERLLFFPLPIKTLPIAPLRIARLRINANLEFQSVFNVRASTPRISTEYDL
jgi:hypothetical protein